MPGETFYFVMRLAPSVSGDVWVSLRHALEPTITQPLKPATPPSYMNDEYCSMVFMIPPDTAPGLYDLELRSGAGTYDSRRCIKIVDGFKTKFRFVHLSNMNVGDLTAPEFDDMLPNEVNLLAPEFIIATGDFTQWSRARDDAASWLRVLQFFEKFNAPVFMLCGVHDHEASFTQFVASKPIGTIDYGTYHGLLLLDHPGNPIDQDLSQLRWIEADLKKNANKQFNFIASNSDELALLDIWRERGDLGEFVKDHKIKMFIVGGSTDWDYKEFADKLAGLGGFNYIRTHESSTCLRDRATGVSHYRVIEVDGDRVAYVYNDDTAAEKLQYSVPTGRLRVFYETANDGSAREITAVVQNALNQAFDNAHVWLRVAKESGATKPTVAPGRLAQVLDAGAYWACDVVVDLPDKGAVKVMAAAQPDELPSPLPIAVQLEGPRDLTFSPERTDFGLEYFSSDAGLTLKLTNNGKTLQTCYPVVQVNGTLLHPDPSQCPRLPLVVEPGESVTVPLVLNLRRVSPGGHAMQVYFLEDPLSRLHTFDVNLQRQELASGDPTAAP